MGVARALSRALSLPHGGGYQVEVCDTGEAALERLRDDQFDLLISDLRLPGIDGLQLLDKAHEISPGTRSILITAFGSPQVEERAHRLADAYVTKPFLLRDLIRVVGRILGAPDMPERPPSEAGAVAERVVAIAAGSKTKASHLKVLACDLDGTLAEDGHVAVETWEVLRQAKAAGLIIILVTGRTLDSFDSDAPYAELSGAIVAEDGAVVSFPRHNSVTLPFGRLPPAVLKQLEAVDVPLERGMASVATRVPHDEAIVQALREVGGGAVVEYNRGAVMILPPGATKGTGLRYALDQLGYSPRSVVACGDAENDRSLFEMVEVAVAVSNALPEVKALADIVLPDPNGAGVRTLLRDLIAGQIPAFQPRPDRQLFLGHGRSGTPVNLNPIDLVSSNLGIFGASRSGKSWLAGWLAQELLKQGYQLCVIDPEGEYRVLGAAPKSLVLGGVDTQLPAVAEVANLLESTSLNLVIDLSAYTVGERAGYAPELLRALRDVRARCGRPHWFLIDEVQSLCPPSGGRMTDLLLEAMPGGGLCLISYRPSQVTPALLQSLDYWLVTRLSLGEEIETLRPFLAQAAGGSDALSRLPALPMGQAYLGVTNGRHPARPTGGFVTIGTDLRRMSHVRHLHKYLRAPLPEHKRFYFRDESARDLGRTAANLWDFREMLSELPTGSLQYHVGRGDFGRWLEDVLHDGELARRLHKVNSRDLHGEGLRQAMLEIVIDRYEELDSLA